MLIHIFIYIRNIFYAYYVSVIQNHWKPNLQTVLLLPQILVVSSLFNFFFFNKFIYLFLAALGLRCCARASHCSGFSCCGALALGT